MPTGIPPDSPTPEPRAAPPAPRLPWRGSSKKKRGEEAKGGVTCSVRIFRDMGRVEKTCDAASTQIELELAEHAHAVLREMDETLAPATFELGGDDGETLIVSLFEHGTPFTKKVDGKLVYWSGKEDNPKNGQLLNFTPAALKDLKILVGKLHKAKIAHGDIHAGNIAIVDVDPVTEEVTRATLIDWSNAVVMDLLEGMPKKQRDVAKGLITSRAGKKVNWITPYVKAILDKNGDTPAQEVFEVNELYDDVMMGIMTGNPNPEALLAPSGADSL